MAFFDRMLDVMKLGEDEDDYYDDDEMYDDDDYDDYDDDDDHSIFHLFGKTMTRMRKKMSSLV